MHASKFVGKALIFIAICSSTVAWANNCAEMADMSFHVASLRDAGVPKATVERRLRVDVSDPVELSYGLIVVHLFYRSKGTAEQLRREVLKQCYSKRRKN